MSSVALSGLSSVVALSRGLPPPSVFFRTFGAYLADTNIKVFTIPLSNTEVSEAEVNAFLRAAKAKRAQHFARRYQWFAKLDVCHYFDSISHRILIQQLCRLFRDKQLLLYFSDLIESYSATEGRGIPIGNLTSQYFANHYLAAADHYAKQQIGVKAMVRYMDDILLFAREKQELADMMNRYLHYLHECLNLESHEPVINRTTHGIPFLGYVVYGRDLRLNKRSKKRYHAKMKELAVGINLGEINEGDYVQHAQCLTSFVAKANTQGFRGMVMKTKGMYLQGL